MYPSVVVLEKPTIFYIKIVIYVCIDFKEFQFVCDQAQAETLCNTIELKHVLIVYVTSSKKLQIFYFFTRLW